MAIGNPAFPLLRFLERGCANLQGKGYGKASIRKEIALAFDLIGRKPTLAIDIGGNVGLYALEIRRRAPECEIYVFEPAATNVAILRERLAGDPRVHIEPVAVSDAAQDAVLYADKAGSGLGSLTKRRLDHFGIELEHQERVKTIRFDGYYDANLRGRELDLVKLDIEGHELGALLGCGEAALRKTRCVQFEFGGCNIDTRTFFQDFYYFFAEHRFDLYRITPIGLMPISKYREGDEFFSTTNFLARNRELS
jgi:FkbM family methyltransferase